MFRTLTAIDHSPLCAAGQRQVAEDSPLLRQLYSKERTTKYTKDTKERLPRLLLFFVLFVFFVVNVNKIGR
jgi:hypothetical protein